MENRIRELRQAYGIKQTELAKFLEVAQNTLSYWETGKVDIDNTCLIKLADYFECSVDYILCRDKKNYKTATEDYLNQSFSDHEKKLILAYRNQPNMQESVCRVLGVEYQSSDAASSSIGKDITNTVKKGKTSIRIPTE